LDVELSRRIGDVFEAELSLTDWGKRFLRHDMTWLPLMKAVAQINVSMSLSKSQVIDTKGLMGLPRLERGTYCLGGSRSIHLSYKP
jgi:hypothetical protein